MPGQEYLNSLTKLVEKGQQAREALKNPFIKRFLEEEKQGCIAMFKMLEPLDDRVGPTHAYFIALCRMEDDILAAIEAGEDALQKLKEPDKLKGVNI